MNISNGNDRYFRTSNFYIACLLFAKDFELVNLDFTKDPKKAEFVFIDKPEREKIIQDFNFSPTNSSESKVDVRKFISAIKTLKDKLYQNKY